MVKSKTQGIAILSSPGKRKGQRMLLRSIGSRIRPFVKALVLIPSLSLISPGIWSQEEEVQVVLTMLGTSGGPQLDPERSNPATLLTVGDDLYLIDCGIGTARRLAEAGIPVARLKAVFITHQHPDHNLGLANVLADRKLISGREIDLPPLAVYGPGGTTEFADLAGQYVEQGFAVFAVQGVGQERIKPIFTPHDVGPGSIYADESITITAHDNTHYVLMDDADRARHHSLSFRIETPQGSIVFSGDTGADAALADFGSDADLLISEIVNLERTTALLRGGAERGIAGISESFVEETVDHMTHQHLPGEAVGRLAEDMNAGALLLNHFGPADTVPAVIAENIEHVRRNFSRDIFAADDLDQFCLARSGDGFATTTKCSME